MPAEPALLPPTEREAVLQEVRRALSRKMDQLCRGTREAGECAGDGDTGGGACSGCPRHALWHIYDTLDTLARAR
jgi:hypothetical protein